MFFDVSSMIIEFDEEFWRNCPRVGVLIFTVVDRSFDPFDFFK
jgi:hypothetical protein